MPIGMSTIAVSLFFFFQAEDGIRDVAVTGVQTCALPIFFAATPIAAGRALPFLDENGKKETDGYKIVRMDEKKLSAELQRQGFLQTCVWQDAPGTFYPEHTHRDRKSTRLNSSHGYISYAAFCLNK